MLKKKEWNYSNSGIMDKTHLRFFTIKSARQMFQGAGLNVAKIECIVGASKMKKWINRIFRNRFIDSITEQYLVVAQKI